MRSERTCILCVESDQDLCELLSFFLEDEGFDVELATTIEQAVQRSSAESFALYLVGDRFSDGLGLDFIRRVRETDRKTSILIQSGYAFAENIQEGLQAGANAYFTKPVEMSEMISKIKELTDKRKAAQ
jgi:DNA-binding response OmpR family regulator